MDPGPQPTADDLREFSRQARDTGRSPRNEVATTEIADAPVRRDEREELISAFEELRLADEVLRARSEAIAATSNELDRERRRFRELFDFAPDAYIITDLYGTIREANVAAGRLLGIDPKSLIGKPLPSFFEESARKQYPEHLDLLCDRDRLDDWEMWLHPRRGATARVSASISRSSRNYLAAEYRWIIHDVTARNQAEEAIREEKRELELRVKSGTVQLAAAQRIKDDLLVSERKAREGLKQPIARNPTSSLYSATNSGPHYRRYSDTPSCSSGRFTDRSPSRSAATSSGFGRANSFCLD